MLLAEAPARDDNYRQPLNGRAGQNLMRYLGVEPSYDALASRFDAVNAIQRLGDAYPWSAPKARERWRRWRSRRPRTRPHVVVCLGRRPAAVAGLPPQHPWGEWATVGVDRVTVLPHPSGLCREYNDPAMRELAGRVLREALGDHQ